MKSIMSHVFLLLQIIINIFICTYSLTHVTIKKVHIHWYYTTLRVIISGGFYNNFWAHIDTFTCHPTYPCSYINGRKSLLLQYILLSDHLWYISAVNEMHPMAKERPKKSTKLPHIDDKMKHYYSLSTGFKTSQRCGMATCTEQLITSQRLC
jgi:hypothetical protein